MSNHLDSSGGQLARITSPQVPALSFGELMESAKVVAASKLFPNIDTTEKAATLMMLCRSEGIDPIQAMRRYHIVQGRPTMRADAMQAEFQSRGGTIEWIQHDSEACEATFSHPAGGTLTIRWDMARARKAGLPQKNPVWNTYPEEMLHARCIGSGVRAILPAVVVGIYTPEEEEDIAVDRATRRPALPPGQVTPTPAPASAAKAAAPDDPKRAFNAAVKKFASAAEAEGLSAEINGDAGLNREKVAALVTRLLDLEPFGDKMPTTKQLEEAIGQLPHFAQELRAKAARDADAVETTFVAEEDEDMEDPFEEEAGNAPATPATPYASASTPQGAI